MQVLPKPVATLWQTFQTWLHPPVLVAPDWETLARSQSRCTFVVWLADEVARDLMANKPRHLTMEALSESVWECRSSGMQQHAEHFLRNYYFTYPSSDHYCKVLRIFRHLVQRNLKQYGLH